MTEMSCNIAAQSTDQRVDYHSTSSADHSVLACPAGSHKAAAQGGGYSDKEQLAAHDYKALVESAAETLNAVRCLTLLLVHCCAHGIQPQPF